MSVIAPFPPGHGVRVQHRSTPVSYRNPVTPSHLPGGEPERALNDQVRSGPEGETPCHLFSAPFPRRWRHERGLAIVTGAGGELGRATAEKLAAAGVTVVGVDRSEEGLKDLPDGVRREAAGPTDPAAAPSVVNRIAAEVGPPEVLVNTIGTYHLGDALTATPEDLPLMIDVNVGAALWLTQAVAPYLRERGSGSIVHVAARPRLEPTAGSAAYAVSKTARVHRTRLPSV